MNTISTDLKTRTVPLSYAQKRIWFLQQLRPNSLVYNYGAVVRLQGELDERALQLALDALLERHEILRTVYKVMDGEPIQVVQPAAPFPLQIHDLTVLPDAANWDKLVRNHADQPFDLETQLPIRAHLYKTGNHEWVFLLERHHIASDNWSRTLILEELSTLYNAFHNGDTHPLPPVKTQYRDYVTWQQNTLTSPEAAADLDYWRRKLAGAAPVQLPADRLRPTVQSFSAAEVSAHLAGELREGLTQLARSNSATLFMVLLAAFKILVARWSGQEDVTIGAPIAGRLQQAFENIPGMFLNTIVLRSSLSSMEAVNGGESPGPSFREFLAQVRNILIEAMDHQTVPFELLLEEIGPERDLSQTPLFSLFFNMFTSIQRDLDFEGLEIEELDILPQRANFDLTVYVRPDAENLIVRFRFNTDIFNATSMETLLSQYFHLLRQILADPGRSVWEYPLSPSPLISISAEAESIWPGSLPDRLKEWVRVQPERPAVEAPGWALSYRELDADSDRLAALLQENGLSKGDIVVILAERTAALPPSVFAVMKSGALFCILDGAHPPERIRLLLSEVRPKAIIDLRISKGGATFSPADCFALDLSTPDLWANLPENSPEEISITADDLATIVFTSGTTGVPKGVVGRHDSLTHFLPWQVERFGLSTKDRFSMLSGLAHDPLQRDIFTAIWCGGTICIPDPADIFTPGKLAEWLSAAEVTFAHLTPAMGQLITSSAKSGQVVASLRWTFFVGERFTRTDFSELRQLAPQTGVINAYGSTEGQRAVSMWILDPGEEPPEGNEVLPIGKGIPGVHLLLLNKAWQLCAAGEVGEILITSRHLAAGYWNDASLTSERFFEVQQLKDPASRSANNDLRCYRTGDLGRYIPNGDVQYVGRRDRQVQIRGYRIEPAEIEAALIHLDEVQEAVVRCLQNDTTGPFLTAYLVPSGIEIEGLEQKPVEQIRIQLQKVLPATMIPSHFLWIPSVPLTPSGKVNEAALPEPELKASGAGGEMTGTERLIAEMLEELTGSSSVGPEDNFFDIGGHSLLAVRLFRMLEEAFAVQLPLTTLFQHSTVRALAAAIDRKEAPASTGVLVPIQPDGDRKPFFCVHGFGGGVLGYADLSRLLGPEQPFYGLQAKGFDGHEPPDGDLPTMARRYIEAIRTVQPRGPYRLGGYCYGGVVAFEMARQLEEQGESAELIAVFEGFAPLRGHRKETIWQNPALIQDFLQNLGYWWRDFLQLGAAGMWGRARRFTGKLYARGLRLLGRDAPVNLRNIIDDDVDLIPDIHRRLMEIHIRALMSYAPKPIRARVTLLRVKGKSLTRTPDRANGWGRLAETGVDVYIVDGQHNTILQPPYVASLANALDEAIEKLEKCSPGGHSSHK